MNEGSRGLLNRRLFFIGEILEKKIENFKWGEIALKKCRERRKRLLLIVYVRYIYGSMLDYKGFERGKGF
jgi:hypothetical protein